MQSGFRASLTLTMFLAVAAVWSSVRAGADDTASSAVERGRHFATALAGCADCHGATLGGGRAFKRDGETVYAANLTGGAGGIAAQSDADIRRAIRTGVAPDGRSLRVMPSREYAVMTDRDVDDVVAFLRSLPVVDRVVPTAASSAAQALPAPAQSDALPNVSRAVTTARDPGEPLTRGAYLTTIGGCTNCHAANLVGRRGPGNLVAPNISRTGIGSWSFGDFQTAMRSGVRPDGRTLSRVMPWETIGKMTDAELHTVYDYLQAQPGPG